MEKTKKEIESLLNQFSKNQKIIMDASFPDDIFQLKIFSLLSIILSRRDQGYLLDTFITVLREIFFNSLKAAAKQIFFEINNFNLENKLDYKNGMIKFRDKILVNIDNFKKKIIKSNFRMQLTLKSSEKNLIINFKSNYKILPLEFERISERLKIIKSNNNFTEIYNEIYDDSEGAGLGISLTYLLLSHAGIEDSNVKFEKINDFLNISIIIPPKIFPTEVTGGLKEKLLLEIERIPALPENVIKLQQMCNNPATTIDEISQKVGMDPAITSDLLRLSNTAGFISGKRVETINEAIITIGLKNLSTLLYVNEAQKIMDKQYKKFEKIWEHCQKTAFYAKQIASIYKFNDITEHVFLAGLLHDIGKIILLSTDLAIVHKISDIIKNSRIRISSVLEETSVGLSHATIGASITKKWGFPQYIIDTIRFHHSPFLEKTQFQDIINIVYLANMLVGIENRKYFPSYIEFNILKKFKITDEKDFQAIQNLLKNNYADALLKNRN